MPRSTAASLIVLAIAGCGGAPPPRSAVPPPQERTVLAPDPAPPDPAPAYVWVDPYQTTIDEALARAAPGGRRVLVAVAAMVDESEVVQGSCWGWTEAVFERAGGEPAQAFRGRQSGPWADHADVLPGDWLYFVHPDGGGTHSAIFLGWTDDAAHVGLTASYVGGRREESGRYATYDLSRVYRIVRMTD